jgi:bleomycin hydrolase
MVFRFQTRPFRDTVLSILWTVGLLFGVPVVGAPALTCAGVFKPVEAIGTVRSDFVETEGFSNELAVQSEPRNQCGLDNCHAYSWLGGYEDSYELKTGNKLRLSIDYIAARQWIEKSLKMTGSDVDSLNINLGALANESRLMFVDYGLIPDSVWKGSRDFDQAPQVGRVKEYIKNIAAQARMDRARAKTPEEKAAITADAQKQVQAIFDDYIGEIPQSFEYEGVTYTPQSFMESHLPFLKNPVVEINVSDRRSAPTVKWYRKKGRDYYETSIYELEKVAQRVIDSGQPVYLAHQHNNQFMDSKRGFFSIGAFNMPKGGGPLSRAVRALLKIKPGAHALQIVGYDLDPVTGRVLKWKVRNSWGTQAGKDGFYTIYADYFRVFANSLTFFADRSIELPQAVRTLKNAKPKKAKKTS